MSLSLAVMADSEGRMQDAAQAYEDVLRSDPTDLDATINLAVLYWQATDYGMSASRQLPVEFVALAGRRLRELLGQASQRFGGRPEVTFWTKYIAWSDFGEETPLDECRNLLRDHPQYLEPAMLLFAQSAGSEAQEEAMELLAKCSVQTTRCRYIASVINGVLKRQKFGKAKH